MSGHYRLNYDTHEVEPCDLMEWAKAFDDQRRFLRKDFFPDGNRLSTVFLGMDHRFGEPGPPLVFETMLFKDGYDVDCVRASTYEEAMANHERIKQEQTA